MNRQRKPLPRGRAYARATLAACLLGLACAPGSTGAVASPDLARAVAEAVDAAERARADIVASVHPRRRAGIRQPVRPVQRVAAELIAPEVERDVPYAGAGGPTLDVHHAESTGGRAPAVMVVHGGAWSAGDKAAIGNVARSLAAAGMVAVNVNYTLAAPGRPGFPNQLDQLRTAVRWVRRNAARIGVDPTRIGAIGSSAGAHLSALLATTGRGPLTAGDRVRAVVSWSGPLELGAVAMQRRLPTKIAGLLGCLCPRRAALASPLQHVSRDDPPMLLVNSRRELIPADQAVRMANRLRRVRVSHRLRLVPGNLHAPRYSPTVLGPSIAYLRRQLR